MTGAPDFKESRQWQRIYAKHIFNLKEKIGKDEFMRRCDAVLGDDFKKRNCNSLKYLFGELKSCMDPGSGVPTRPRYAPSEYQRQRDEYFKKAAAALNSQ